MSQSVARKQLELRMVVTADASHATAAMKQLAADAERAGLAVKNLSAGPGGFGGGGAAAGGAAAGGSGGILAAAGKAVGPIAAAAGFASMAANLTVAVQNLSSEFMTAREKTLGFAASIPVIGERLSSLMGSIMDASERLFDEERALRVDHLKQSLPISMHQDSAASEFRMRRFGLEREVSGAGFNLQAIREYPTLASQMAPYRTGFGGIAGALLAGSSDTIDPRLTAAMEDVQGAKRGHRAAELAAGESAAAVDASRPGMNRAMGEFRGAFERANESWLASQDPTGHRERGFRTATMRAHKGLSETFGDGRATRFVAGMAGSAGFLAPSSFGESDKGSNLALAEATLRLTDARAKAALAVAEHEQKVTDNKQRQLNLAQQEHNISKAEVALGRTKVQLLDEQIGRARQGASQFGGMDRVTQGALLGAAKRFKAGGREQVTEAEFAMLVGNSITEKMVAQRTEADANSDPRHAALVKLVGQRDVADLKAEREKLKAELDVKVQLDEEKTAKALEEAFKRANIKDQIGEIFKNLFELKFRDPEMGLFKAKAGLMG